MAHGLLFVAYCLLLALCMRKFKWSFGFGVYLFVATLIPFGTFVTDRKLKEKIKRLKILFAQAAIGKLSRS